MYASVVYISPYLFAYGCCQRKHAELHDPYAAWLLCFLNSKEKERKKKKKSALPYFRKYYGGNI